jgi:membrane protein YqaA with SNARE-associated domain
LISVLIRLLILFLISVVSNATAFFGASYTLFATAELSATGVSLQSFILVVFVTALGATIGKIVIYYTGFGLKKRLSGNRNVRLLGTWIGKSGFYVGLFITALLPVLPFDDYVYIGAGANKGRLAPMLGVTLLAKLAKSAFEILLELSGLLEISKLTHHLLGLSRLELSIVGSLAFIVLGVATYELDWESIARGVAGLFGRHPAQLPRTG